MRRPRQDDNDTSVSFLDVIACAFGAIALLVLILPIGDWATAVEPSGAADYGRLLFRLAGLEGEVAVLEREVSENEALAAQAAADLDDAEVTNRRIQGLVERTREESARLRRRSAAIAAGQAIQEQGRASPVPEKALQVDTQLAGIPVDSEYIAFVVDTSGSVTGNILGLPGLLPSIWERVVEEIGNVLSLYPQVRGFQILNDQGSYLYDRTKRRWMPDSPASRRRALDRMRTWRPYSGSNPAPGIVTAVRDLYAKDRRMAIFVIGDEYQSDDFNGFLEEVDRSVATRTLGGAALRIHAIGFWNQGFEEGSGIAFSASSRNFGILMRELTRRHQGAFLALPAENPSSRVSLVRRDGILRGD